jgi:hypothetical protein
MLQFLTAHLVFTILMLAAEKSKDTFIAPIGIGLALFIIEIAGVNFTGAAVNPARSFGPCVAGASFTGYHWIYWLGPVLGALVAAGFYHFIKVSQRDTEETLLLALFCLLVISTVLQLRAREPGTRQCWRGRGLQPKAAVRIRERQKCLKSE